MEDFSKMVTITVVPDKKPSRPRPPRGSSSRGGVSITVVPDKQPPKPKPKRPTGGISVTTIPPTQQELRLQELVSSLKAREQIRQEAQERGRGFSRREVQRRLRELGTSTSELRQATRLSQEQFRKTGISVTQQIRDQRVAIVPPTQQELRQRELKQLGPTREVFERQQELRRSAQVQSVPKLSLFRRVVDLPSKAIERVTGRKPREAFRFLIGSIEKDVTKPVTAREVVVETTQVPSRVVSIIGAGLGAGAKRVSERISPKGVPIRIRGKSEREVKFQEPAFGTVTPETTRGIIERKITVPERPERNVRIFEPERVEEGVRIGTTLGAMIAVPLAFAPGFVTEGVETAIDKERKTTQRILGGTEAVLGATILGRKVSRFLRAPIITRTPTRPIREPTAVEVQKVVEIKGKPETLSLFKIKGEISPPVIVEETTRLKKAISLIGRPLERTFQVGKEPVVSLQVAPKITKIPAKEFVQFTPEVVVGKKPFIVAEIQSGRRFAVISRIKGKQIPTSVKEFEKLPRLEQFLWKRTAEEITGRPVAKELVPKILSRQKERVISIIKEEKVLRITPRKTGTEIKLAPQKGKEALSLSTTEAEKVLVTDTVELIESRSIFKEIMRIKKSSKRIKSFEEQIELAEDKIKLLKGRKTGIAEIERTKEMAKQLARKREFEEAIKLERLTFPRATGKTPTLETKIFRIKPTPPKEEGVRFITPSQIEKTPLSKTFQEEVTPSLASQIPLPKSKIVEPSKIVLEKPITPTERALPFILGGTGIESRFAGTGKFELTTSTPIRFRELSIVERQPPGIEKPPITIETTIPRINQSIGIELRGDTILKTKQRVSQRTEQLGLQESVTLQEFTPSEEFKTITETDITTDTLLETQQDLRLKTRLETEQTQPTTTPPPTPPPFFRKVIIEPEVPKPEVIIQAQRIMDGFKVFVKKKGKDVSIGEFETLSEAKKKLTKRLRTTLRASGFIERKGKRLSALETGLIDGEFRISKTDTFRIVERRGRRIKKGSPEVTEIQFFRKQKGGRNLLGGSTSFI